MLINVFSLSNVFACEGWTLHRMEAVGVLRHYVEAIVMA